MLLNFLCQKILCKHNFFIHEKDTQLKLDTKDNALRHERVKYIKSIHANSLDFH